MGREVHLKDFRSLKFIVLHLTFYINICVFCVFYNLGSLSPRFFSIQDFRMKNIDLSYIEYPITLSSYLFEVCIGSHVNYFFPWLQLRV